MRSRQHDKEIAVLESQLEIIERADEKIANFENAVATFLHESSNAVGTNHKLDIAAEGRLKLMINDIVADLWTSLHLPISLLKNIRVVGSGEPPIWRDDFPIPAVVYGVENESALPIIEEIEPYARRNEALHELLRNLITISDRNQKLLVGEVDSPFRNVREFSNPNPKLLVVGFIVNYQTAIQQALRKGPIASSSEINSAVTFLSQINTGIETLIRNLMV
jgi:hypothetical protein